MSRLLAGLALSTIIACQIGCSMTQGRLARMLPSTGHYDDGTDDSSDPWIGNAAAEGRSEYSVEKQSDPLGIRPYLMSQKARDIERNLGFE